MNYYAIFKGNKTGVFNTWDECKSNIEGYIDPVYKKFDNRLDAEHFIKNGKILKYNSLLNYVVIDDKPEILEIFTTWVIVSGLEYPGICLDVWPWTIWTEPV